MLLILLGFALQATPINTGLNCHYFYGGVDGKWLENSPAWFTPSLFTFKEALKTNDAQARFESQILGLPNRKEIDTDEKLGALLGQIFSQSKLTPVVIYSNGTDFIDRAAGAPPPAGYTVFQGVYSDYTYYSFIAKGLYPIGDIKSEIKYFGFAIPETTVKHGLAHLGGFFDNKFYAEQIQKLGNYYLSLANQPKSNRVRYRIAFFSESFWFASNYQKESIHNFLNSISDFVSRDDLNSLPQTQNKLRELNLESLLSLSEFVLKGLPDSTPLGGGSRDYAEKLAFLRQMESADATPASTRAEKTRIGAIRNQAQQGYDLITSLSLRESVFSIDLKRAIKNKNAYEIVSNLSKLLIHAHALNKFEINDWYEAATSQETEGAKKIHEHVCHSGIYNSKLSLYKTFCL